MVEADCTHSGVPGTNTVLLGAGPAPPGFEVYAIEKDQHDHGTREGFSRVERDVTHTGVPRP